VFIPRHSKPCLLVLRYVQVKKTWLIKNGLMFERQVLSTKGDFGKTPKK